MKSGFDLGFTPSSQSGHGGFGAGFRAAAPTTPVVSSALFSNLSTYIVSGQRLVHGASPTYRATETTIRTGGLNMTKVLKAASTVSVQGFKFIRVPFYNWQTTDCNLTLTLSIVSGGGGTIDGGSGTKTYSTMSITLNPSSGRTTSDTLAGCNARRGEYDTLIVYAATPAVLTAGTYQISVATSAAANRSLAVFWKSEVAIDTSFAIYPDPADSSNAFSYPVMEVLSVAP